MITLSKSGFTIQPGPELAAAFAQLTPAEQAAINAAVARARLLSPEAEAAFAKLARLALGQAVKIEIYRIEVKQNDNSDS